jgi:diguanylate cyclase
MPEKKPIEIARESLLRLNARKLAPTPANYSAVYNEILGVAEAAPFPQAPLRRLASALPQRAGARHRQLLEQAIAQCDWRRVEEALAAWMNAASEARTTPPAETVGRMELLETMARLIENALPALGDDDEKFSALARQTLACLRDARAEPARLKAVLSQFGYRLSFTAEDQAEVRATLMRLLHLVIESVSEWNAGDGLIERQMAALRSAATPPLALRRLDDLERRMKDVLVRQVEARGRERAAQAEMRQLLARFIERLTYITGAASSYHGKLEAGAQRIANAKSLEEIAPVLAELMSATRAALHDAGGAREELTAMRARVEAHEAELGTLRSALETALSHARHDPLTGVLNRKGLAEVMTRELADMRRTSAPLSVALLDIDNFKKLNDSLGHGAGDAALTHLAQVARESLRPRDTLSRHGGEEFVIVMPDTELASGVDAMTRLQRALTRRYFLAGEQQILITFSAGVAQLDTDESGDEAIDRADQAMYLAKRAGKNRVMAA